MKAKKVLKIIGWSIGSLAALLVVAVLLLKYVFREEAVAYLLKEREKECLAALRSAPPFDAAPNPEVKLAYEADSLRAQEIRAYFRLDTLVKPDASTWENTLAVAQFVSAHVPHINSCQIPREQRTAIGLWKYCQTENPALNCMYHALLLQELLQASGITNRYVRCLPADSTDTDCHVVNHVWLPELHKWAMVDSDQGAYLTGTDGQPLSLEEMRQYTLDGTPITQHFFPGKHCKGYLAYWTKNLYWFNTPETVGLGKELNKEIRMAALVPAGFQPFVSRDVTRCTQSAAQFWAMPVN